MGKWAYDLATKKWLYKAADKKWATDCGGSGCAACLVKPANVTVQITGITACAPGGFDWGPVTAVIPILDVQNCRWFKVVNITYGGQPSSANCIVDFIGVWRVTLTSSIITMFYGESTPAGCHDARAFSDVRVCSSSNPWVGGTCILTPGP